MNEKKQTKPKANIKAYIVIVTDSIKTTYEVAVDQFNVSKLAKFDGLEEKVNATCKVRGKILNTLTLPDMLKAINAICQE